MSKMNIKEKDTKTLEKFKLFFRSNKGNYKCNEDHILTQEIEREICSQNQIHHRIRAIKDLCDDIRHNNWEEKAAEKLWNLVKDLLSKDTPKEHRHTVFNFLCCLVEGQYSRLSSLIRVKFFLIVKDHEIPEDIYLRLQLLQRLTTNGKDIRDLEEKMGPFLLEWMPLVTNVDGQRGADFLSLLINVIKYNSAYIDEEIVSGLVQYTCHLCCCSNSADVVSGCLSTLETIVGYHKLQADSLQTFIAALCKSVNVESYCSISWEIMRKLLGTHMGHSALCTMCRFLQDPTFQRDVRLLRGAVFYVNMGLWSANRILKLECTPISVLPSFYQALNCNHPIVVFEVILAMKGLIIKFGAELLEPIWSIVLDIIEKVIDHVEKSNQPATKQVIPPLHETLNSIEFLIDNSQYNGRVQRFYELVERCSDARPENSVLKLIDYQASLINPTYYHWQLKLKALMERYYTVESRTNIRVKVLDVVTKVIHINRSRYEDELIEKIIVPYLQHVDMDPDITIRNVAANMLVDLCLECEIKRCLELLDILEKIINRPFTSNTPLTADTDIKDIKTGVVGLIKILTTKIYRLPSSHAITAYKILANHLELHYKEPQVFLHVSTIRYLIFKCFLKIRVNSLYQLGFAETETSNTPHFSPYLLLEHVPSTIDRLGSGGGSSSPPPVSPAFLQRVSFQVTSLSLALACKNIISCLKLEKDWKVLQFVLKEMPNIMQNRALILSKHNNDIDYLTAVVCSMVTDNHLRISESFFNIPQRMTLSDFLMCVFSVLASLVSYHAHLDPNRQQYLIKCLEIGLTTRCVGQCITSLTTCTLEMRDAMNKLLPDVLKQLSKISATVHIAIPILEFLSTLTRLPKVFSSFICDQYRLVFAILLPYTNPFKYNHYIVSLAHYVIAIWFLKCRLPLRKDFVKFITAGLKGNVLEPLEGLLKKDFSSLNEDSSHRKRSSSLTEQGSRGRRERPIVGNSIISDLKPPMDENLMNLNIELTETCLDLMARYTFSTYTARPKRLPAADFLLKEGQSMTWLLGNRLITVTTSGCSSKAMRGGLCDNCWTACKAFSSTPEYKAGGNVLRRSSEENRLSRQSSGHTGSSGNTATNSPTEEVKKSVTAVADDDSGKHTIEKRDFAGEKDIENNKLDQILGNDKQDEYLPCACWCQGWAEIYVRRPTGDVSWIMRIQNSGQFDGSFELPMHDITTLYMPTSDTWINRSQDTTTTESFEDENEEKSDGNSAAVGDEHQATASKATGPITIPGSPGARFSTSRQSSRDSIESLEDGDDDLRKSRNPVRRSNSSPEMSANWKNPFLNKDKLIIQSDNTNSAEFDGKHGKNNYFLVAKDMRVSCEAIPEEISGMGTTPPSVEITGEHSNVLKTQYSYPETTQPTGNNSGSSSSSSSSSSHSNNNNINSNTVPASPTAVQSSGHFSIPRNHQHHLSLSKPPQSPTQTYSRTLSTDTSVKQMSSSVTESKPPSGRFHQNDRSDQKKDDRPDPSALPPFSFRDRGHTISVMSPVKPPRASPRIKELPKTRMNPSFVFLQLYHSSYFGSTNEKPLLVSPTPPLQRAITNFDRIQPYETHKIGVLYIGAGQASNEAEILANQHGSLRYAEFLQRLGTLVCLKDVDESVFLGGLDRNGEHGNFTYIWQDDVTQVAFHVATLMPTQQSDPKSTKKKQHIGNDYVTIVYNESGESYDIQTVKGQFNYACVVIQPLDHGTNQVTVQAREELAEHIGHSELKIISDQNLGILTRQLALHANLASMVSSSLKQKGHSPYASNWLERLRNIKRLRRRLQESSNNNSTGQIDEQRSSERVRMDDFTEYTT
ncbi:tuberin [Chelonus insularis]|uniref:tuberin n=1 Tax=Chelonus insularis TaxID=460826 RepID=UPI00158C4873|nr:tuberin [Chelonus insularis]